MKLRNGLPAVLLLLSAHLIPVVVAEPAGAVRPADCSSPRRSESAGRLPRGTGEVSGLVASSRHPGVGWMIRDSGAPASLYMLRFDGRTPRVREFPVRGAENTDWEDISYRVGPDGRGQLLVVESTQNREDPFVYQIPEPNPDGDRKANVAQRYRWRYPDSEWRNTEASFVFNDDLVLVAKTNPPRLYRFDQLKPDRVNRPRYVGELPGSGRVSLARLSPNADTLVALDHETVTVYRSDDPDAGLSGFVEEPPSRRQVVARGDNIEAGDYFPAGSCQVVVLSERKNVYLVHPK